MCGIFGLINNLPETSDKLVDSLKLLNHRGPDSSGFWRNPQNTAFLGHTRLSILDLSDAAQQPMFSEDKNYSITYNGEVYNFQEIRSELESLGHQFHSNSDTEVILKGYIQWQEKLLDKLNGMFAFAIWDEANQKLFAARDRMGQKPFYYSEKNHSLCFASEIKSILHLFPNLKVNFRGLSDYLHYGYVLDPDTFYDSLFQLKAGHYLTWQNNTLQTHQWWDLANLMQESHQNEDEQELQEEFLSLAKDSTRLRLISDVPVGAFLSGGIDSSMISSLMCQLRSPQDVKTFSIGFKEEMFSELKYSHIVADSLGTKHKTQIVENNLDELTSKMAITFDQPFADTSAIPMLALAKMTRKDVTVALSGDGADELLGGYDTYRADIYFNKYKKLPKPLKKAFSSFSKQLPGSRKKIGLDYKLKQFTAAHSMDSQRAHAWWRQLFNNDEITNMVHPEFLPELKDYDPFDKISAYYKECPHVSSLNQHMFVDLKTWLPNDILEKVDRTTMAYSLESRNPFLDHRIVEFCMNLPKDLKANRSTGKIFMKRCLTDLLPKDIINRKKAGFNAPVTEWFSEQTNFQSKFINPDFSKQLLQEHLNYKKDNSFRLFNLLQLAKFKES